LGSLLVFETCEGGTFFVLLLTTTDSKACLITYRLRSAQSDRWITWEGMIYSGQALLFDGDIMSMLATRKCLHESSH